MIEARPETTQHEADLAMANSTAEARMHVACCVAMRGAYCTVKRAAMFA